jgi:uncharacterized protein
MDALAIDRRGFLRAVGTAGAMGFAGCIGEETTENGDEEEEPEGGERLTFHAGGTGGTYYPLAGDFQRIVESETAHSMEVQATGASVENATSLGEGAADFALIQNDVAYFAREGTGLEEFEDDPIENVRGVATLYPENVHVITRADSGIESLAGLEGRTINTGGMGSGTRINALQILETAGISSDEFEEENADFRTAAGQVGDGDVDAAFIVGGWPVDAVEELARTEDIEIVGIDGETREELLESAEWFSEDTIPGGTYDGVVDDVESVALQAMIATREELDAQVVEEVTAAIFDNVDQVSLKGEFIDAESAQEGMSIELHEGAAAYFDEA